MWQRAAYTVILACTHNISMFLARSRVRTCPLTSFPVIQRLDVNTSARQPLMKLSETELAQHASRLTEAGWIIAQNACALRRTFEFKDFVSTTQDLKQIRSNVIHRTLLLDSYRGTHSFSLLRRLIFQSGSAIRKAEPSSRVVKQICHR